jgi:hypothetical protein
MHCMTTPEPDPTELHPSLQPHPFDPDRTGADDGCLVCGGTRTDGRHLRWLAANPTEWKGDDSSPTPDIEMPPLDIDEPDDCFHALALELADKLTERDTQLRQAAMTEQGLRETIQEMKERAQVVYDDRDALRRQVEEQKVLIGMHVTATPERVIELEGICNDLDAERANQVNENIALRRQLAAAKVEIDHLRKRPVDRLIGALRDRGRS